MRGRFARWVAGAAVVALVVGIGAVPAFASVSLTFQTQPQSFSPNNDGLEDTLTVEYCLSEGANLDIVVENAALTVVRTIESGVSHSAGCDFVTWDGKDTGGAVVTNGAYTLAFHAAGGSGTDDETYNTAVDTRTPGVLTSPHPGNTLSGTASFVFTPTSGFSTITSVSVDCIGQADSPAGDGTFTASGDTGVCPEGSNTIAAHVSFTDTFGASHSWSSPSFGVTVHNPVRAELSIDAPSRAFSPNADGQEDTVDAVFCVSRDSTVTAVVKNASNAIIRTIESNTAIGGAVFTPGLCRYYSGGATVTWDGKNDAHNVVVNGNYTIAITATDDQMNTANVNYATAVDTRVPGTITQPASGAHLSGTAPFVFTPTSGFDALGAVAVDCLGPAPSRATERGPGVATRRRAVRTSRRSRRR